ncbi:MAG TPA: hypothetical protein VKU00_23685 [Chthonomonadaceae bacterium]|nr:hypothetical protein [Chthonomonadaceae bacterium]
MVIIYVYRPFEAAVRGVIHRAVETGRTVPLNVLAADHVNAPQTVLRLAQEHVGNERMQVFLIDNSSEDVRLARVLAGTDALDFLAQIRHNDTNTLTRQAEEYCKMKSENEREPCGPSPAMSPPPSDAATVAERGREIADLLLRGLQEGVEAEQEENRRLERALQKVEPKAAKAGRKKSAPTVEA